MDQITDLRELLKHELKDLYSAETQIIEGLPKMVETAKNPQLKKALSDHLKVTREQKKRLEKIQELLNIVNDTKEVGGGFFANLFKSKEGEEHCKAMEGLIKEGESIMKEDMEPAVMDAALIAAAQKIEHYEIGSYGTARAYAEQMGMKEVERLLRQTLDEEYFADDSLTKIALEKVNIVAESAGGSPVVNKDNSKSNGRQQAVQSSQSGKNNSKSGNKNAKNKTNSVPQKTVLKKAAAKSPSSPVKSAAPKKSPGKQTSSKSSPAKRSTSRTAVKQTAPKKSAPKKAAAKKSSGNKPMLKKAAPKKSAAKKSTSKSAVKKSPSNKSAGKRVNSKTAPKKTAAKKTANRNSSVKKAALKKSAAKKVVRRR